MPVWPTPDLTMVWPAVRPRTQNLSSTAAFNSSRSERTMGCFPQYANVKNSTQKQQQVETHKNQIHETLNIEL
jgi:hypothetical protein